jgi:hypothetical protein
MVIVFDAGELGRDRALKKPASRALLEECQAHRIRVVVPRAVLEEVISGATGRLEEARNKVARGATLLDEMFETSPLVVPELDVDALTSQYRDEIEARLRDHNVEIVEPDRVSHQEVIARDLAKRPPFDESGRGYRDALTWHAIRDLVMGEGESVTLVTRDTDFSASKAEHQKLHPVLVGEIGGNEGAVVIVDDLGGAMRRLGAVREDLQTAFAQTVDAVSGEIAQSALAFLTDLTPYGIDGLEISGFLVNLTVEDVVEVWGIVSATVTGTLDFEYYGTLNEVEYEIFRDRRDSRGEFARSFVDDAEWNDENRYATVYGSGDVRVRLEINVEREDDSATVDVAWAELVPDGEQRAGAGDPNA